VEVERWTYRSYPNLDALGYYCLKKIDGEVEWIRDVLPFSDFLDLVETRLKKAKTPEEKAEVLVRELVSLDLEAAAFDRKEVLEEGKFYPALSSALTLGLIGEKDLSPEKEEEVGKLTVPVLVSVKKATVVEEYLEEDDFLLLPETRKVGELIEEPVLIEITLPIKNLSFYDEAVERALFSLARERGKKEVQKWEKLISDSSSAYLDVSSEIVAVEDLEKGKNLRGVPSPLLELPSPVNFRLDNYGVPLGFVLSSPFQKYSSDYRALFVQRFREGQSPSALLNELEKGVEDYYLNHPFRLEVSAVVEEERDREKDNDIVF